MLKPSFLQTLTSAAIIATLSGCGGGGGVSSSGASATDQTDATGNTVTNPTTTPETISGRVADGYLQGAVVCVDLNENRSCDDDEPSAISGEGGTYEIVKTAETEGKPIVADVPASAIDEDTNEPIGKELVLSAPAERPDFISPITTLVHQELDDNPALDVDAAEASVKAELGLGDDEETSLFTDYVEQSRDENAERPEQFQYLHQTAQIVARMMQEIQDTIEEAVTAEGVDLAGDKDARKALQRLLREEVRNLLPEITRAVSDSLAAENAAETEGVEATEFDPDAITTSLRPTTVDVDADRLQAEVNRRPAERTTVEEILTDGFYWIDVDCDYDRYDEAEPTDADTTVVRPANDEFIFDTSSLCQAEYGHIVLADSGDSIVESRFEYDAESASWLQVGQDDEDYDDEPYTLRLVDGEWTAEDGPDSSGVEFTADGGAIITTNDGRMTVSAAVRDLADRPVLHHLWDLGAHEDFSATSDSELFPADSSAYIFNLTRTESEHILFNWYDDSGENHCGEFNGNCNAVQQVGDDGMNAVATLEAVVTAAADGITLTGLVHDYNGQPIDAELQIAGNGNNATGGLVKWRVNEYQPQMPEPTEFPDGTTYPNEPVDLVCVDATGIPDPTFEPLPEPEIDSVNPVDGPIPDHNQILQDESFDQVSLPPETVSCVDPRYVENLIAEDDASGVEPGIASALTSISRQAYGTSRWQLVEVQGVEMIELSIPVPLRHRIDMDDAGAILLIEQDGFVRRGMRFSDNGTDTEVMYNDTAFDVMQDVMQGFVSQR